MGNEASLEGGAGGSMAGMSVSAPPGSGQLIKPVNGAAAGAGAALEPGVGVNRLAGGSASPSSPRISYGSGSERGTGGDFGMSGMQPSGNPYKKLTHESPRHGQTSPHPTQIQASPGSLGPGPGQHASRRNLQVDFSSGGRSGRSPSVSPDRSSAPTSPYSVPQIAPMPSSKLCPVCNTTELTTLDGAPNSNKCTQCQTTVCNQCGFNPNPHLTGVKEWLCLNCQMQRALGIDMTTPRSKSQQQIHSPSHQPKTEPLPKTQPVAQPTQLKTEPQTTTQPFTVTQRQMGSTGPNQSGLHGGPQAGFQMQKELRQPTSAPSAVLPGSMDTQRQRGEVLATERTSQGSRIPHPGAVPLPGLAKAQSQSDLGRGTPVHFGGQPSKTRSAGSSPAHHPPHHDTPQDGLTKLFGFGASLLNQASTLISVDPLPGSSQHPSPARHQPAQGSRVIFSNVSAGASSKPMGSASTVKGGPGGAPVLKGPVVPPQQQPLQQKPQQQPPASQAQKMPKQQLPTQLPSASQEQQQQQQQQPSQLKQPQLVSQKTEVPTCPLCKTAFNVGTPEPPNYRSCTQCQTQVCNLCGFNPTPHLLEKKEWLCLNCQTQRLMSGGIDPVPVPQPSPSHQPVGSLLHQQLSNKPEGYKPVPSPQQKPTVSHQTGFSDLMGRPSSDMKVSTQPCTVSTAPASTTTTHVGDGGLLESGIKHDKLSEPEIKDKKLSIKKGSTESMQTTAKDEKRELQSITKYYEETSKTNSNHDLSRSPQSLSDTGYSSDGISSSQSEITGLIHEEELKLSERGLTDDTPPSPSELIKLESSMRSLLESKMSSESERIPDKKRGKDHGDMRKHRSRSISISPEEYDSDEDLEEILEEDDPADQELRSIPALAEKSTKKKQKPESEEITDEEFMRMQIMEMSADEENDEEEEMEEEEDDEDEGYGYKKVKKTQKHISDSGKEKRRLTYHSSSFEEESKTTSDVYKGSAEEDLMASQGGLRRFKTIELNNTNSYTRDMELNNDNDLSLDREPELEMESLTGSPDERSRGDYSSTLPPTTSSYSSGVSPTSISSMEEDSDSSPSRRQQLEEAKQQRKARHRSHGPLLPTIEDSSEEDELREEEELLREQEKMREVEQQRIRSTVRKTKRDKEELRAQRRRERSKTPPSNLSPIEDASPTEELRQAAEMEELHRSSCSEYSPSADSDGEGYEMSPKLYKSGSEYNLPTFMSLYSPTEKPETTSSTAVTTSSSGKLLKSAEEVYEEMMRKAEMLQKQQKQQKQHTQLHSGTGQQFSTAMYQESDVRNRQDIEDEYDYSTDNMHYESEETVDIYEEIRQTSQNIAKQLDDQMEMDVSYSDKQLLDTGSAFAKLIEQSNALLTPGTSPTQISAPVSFSETGTGGRIPDVRVTQHFSKDGTKDRLRNQTGKNGITPAAAATTFAAYGVYARDTVTVSQTSTSQTVSTSQPNLYGRQSMITSGNVSNVSNKIAAITQAYNQKDLGVRRVAVSKGVQMRDSATSSEPVIESGTSSVRSYSHHDSPPVSPTSSPIHSPTHLLARRTAELSTQTVSPSVLSSRTSCQAPSVVAQGTQTSHRPAAPPLFRQQSSQDTYYMVRTKEVESTNPKPGRVNTATSPLSSPTRFSRQSTFDAYSPPVSPPDTPPYQQSPVRGFHKNYVVEKVNVGTSMTTTASMYTRGSLSMENISLCRISTVPGTTRIEPGQTLQSGSVVDLRSAVKQTPIIMTDQGMDLTSLATESRKYSGNIEISPARQSTTIQPLIMNLNTQEQLHLVTSTTSTVSVTVAASMFISHPKQSVLYCDPLENRVDLGTDMGTVVCLAPNKPPPIDPAIPKIDAKLEDLSIQQEQLLKQQQKLQQQQQLLEQQLQQHHRLQQQQAASFATLNFSSQLPLLKKNVLVTQTSTATEVNVISPTVKSEGYSAAGSHELTGTQPETCIMNLSNARPHAMMVQMDSAAQGSTVSQLIKSDENQDAMNLSGQIKAENQATCCDMVYNLPFGGSCVRGPFSQKREETSTPLTRATSAIPTPYQQPGMDQDRQAYQDYAIKSYTLPLPGRLQSSMSETNLADAYLPSYSEKFDSHFQAPVEPSTERAKDHYGDEVLGTGIQYGSYTDLRQGDVSNLPIRRYNSLTNISSDYGYFSGDFAESNLAQYSATTARELSRMCAALNSIDRYSSNPDFLQLSGGRSGGTLGRMNYPQGPRLCFKYSADGKPMSHSQALTDLINARQASLRAMYPSAIRSADGMIYSTINTPIVSTVPITTQPASLLQPLIRGVCRPYPTPNMTPVPLASLTRMPLTARTGHGPIQFTTPNPLVVSTSTKVPPSTTTVQDAPLYLGKTPAGLSSAGTVTQSNSFSSVPCGSVTSASLTTQRTVPASQPDVQAQPINLSQSHIQHQQAKTYAPSSPKSKMDLTISSQEGKMAPKGNQENQEKDTEEMMHQQQEQLLQIERERVELEKLRQLRLQEELERERSELQRHREKEQMLVQREIQELQTIKQQVLQHQQAERESQLVLQREQLAQQKQQLDQIQSLQQQLQQQLEEQKRQKTNAATASNQGVSDQVVHPQDMLYSDVLVFSRPLPNSSSEMCLRNTEEHTEIRSMRKQRSMPRLQDGIDGESTMFPLPQRLIDSSVQTDDDDGEEKYFVARRRRTRRSVDCSVQTDDDEDKAEWEQPVRRRRSRYSRHSAEAAADHKLETPPLTTAKTSSSSIAIQTIRDCSCQTETEQLVRVSPNMHITVPDLSKVEIVHYISGPERTPKGQSLSCQTDPETQSQNIVIPQISVATTVSPTSVQLVGSGDQISSGQQNVLQFARRRPDPLEFGYQQHHLQNESLSSLIRQQPKSPQQKSCIAEAPPRHQALPRPMKNVQRSLSDPKPLSPTTEEKARISLYQQQALQSQLAALQQSSLLRKVKRTLPSPPPEETQMSMVTPNVSHMYVPAMPTLKGGSRLAAKASLLKDLTHELKAVEQESTKLRKQQAELEEEEKEIDAKLRYLELGITQRKETLAKERDRRELAYLRCMGDSRDYMSDSELNNLRLTAAATSYESNGLLNRPSTAPLSQFTCELNTAAQFPPTSSFISYQYPQSLQTAPTLQTSTMQSTSFNQPPYPSVTQAQALPQPTPLQSYPTPSYQVQGTFSSHTYPPSQPPYPTDSSVQPGQPGFQAPLPGASGLTAYPTHSTPYPSQAPPYPVSQASSFPPQTETLPFHQKPRQTSLADLEHKLPTNYEVISNPTVVVTTTCQDTSYNQPGFGPSYGQYGTTMASTYGPYSSSVSSTYGVSSTTSASTAYGPYTTVSSSAYGQYTTTIANTYGYTVTTASSYGQYNSVVTNTYGQTTLSDHMHSVDNPSMYNSEALYGSSNLEQSMPRNYVMIDDIGELTKEGMGSTSDSHRIEGHGRYGSDGLHGRGGSSFGRPEDERDSDLYDQHHGRGKSTCSYQAQRASTHGRVVGNNSMGGGSSYYCDDNRHSTSTWAPQRHYSKNLCPPAVMSSRRSKHRKQGIEQKISKFSPIEEAHDVEADLASYSMSSSTTSGYGSGSYYHKLQDGLRSTFNSQRGSYDEEHFYGYGRSRSAGYGMDKISPCERGYRSRSYDRDYTERSYRSSYGQHGHSQYSDKENSHLIANLMGVGRTFNYPTNSYGSSHSLPDVQDHIRDLPRTHVYKPDDMYIIDDMHCAVSDSEAYHLGQEETDWFEKPRDVRGSRHYGSSGHSGRRSHVKHTYHDYDEPPEDLWPQDEYGHTRQTSSREHRHHTSGSSGRHSSRHSDEPRSSRSSRSSKDTSVRHDSRSLSSSGRRGDTRSQGYHSSDYSRDTSGHHHSSRSGKQSSHHQGSSSRKQQDHTLASRQPGSLGPGQKGSAGSSSQSRQIGSQPVIDGQQGQRTQLQQQAQTSSARPGPQTGPQTAPQMLQSQQLQAKPGQIGPTSRQPASLAQTSPAPKPEPVPVVAIGSKAVPGQPGKTTQPPLTGIGSKAVPRPGGIGSAAAGMQSGMDGESMLSKILPGGAAEQAGKLGEAISGFGKKFTSLW